MSQTETLDPKTRQQMTKDIVISSDSHMTEPPRLWEERIEKNFRARAPRYVFDQEKNSWMFLIDGMAARNVNISMAVGQKPEDYKEFFKKGIETARPGGWGSSRTLERYGNRWRLRSCTLHQPWFPYVQNRRCGLSRSLFQGIQRLDSRVLLL